MTIDLTLDSLALDGRVPNIQDYFGLWAIHEATILRAVAYVRDFDLALHIRQSNGNVRARTPGDAVVVDGDIAIVELRGTLMKGETSLGESTSTVLARRAVRKAASDPHIAGILLLIDSPGGTFSGTKALADDVAAAASVKPTYAAVEDLCASAAYFIAAASTRIASNDSALVGSIGTYCEVHDTSEMAGREGRVVRVIRAGDYKGMGTPGTKLTDEQIAEVQRIVDECNSFFLKAVSTGRNLSMADVRRLADGRLQTASDAKRLGLIDAIESADDTLARLRKATQSAGSRPANRSFTDHVPESKKMTDTTPATLDDLETCLVGADAEFIMGQLRGKATLDQARSAWTEEQNTRLAAATQRADESDRRAASANDPKGAKHLAERKASDAGETDESCDDPIEAFGAAVRELVTTRKMTRLEASCAVAKRNPQLHRAYLLATNPIKFKQDLLRNRFEMQDAAQ